MGTRWGLHTLHGQNPTPECQPYLSNPHLQSLPHQLFKPRPRSLAPSLSPSSSLHESGWLHLQHYPASDHFWPTPVLPPDPGTINSPGQWPRAPDNFLTLPLKAFFAHQCSRNKDQIVSHSPTLWLNALKGFPLHLEYKLYSSLQRTGP